MAAATLLVTIVLAACSSGEHPSDAPTTSDAAVATTSPSTDESPTADVSGLEAAEPCDDGWTCARLAVPLDRRSTGQRMLRLPVIVETETEASRGLLVVLAGGPGQPAVSQVRPIVENLGPDVLDAYRVALVDQRGTGADALTCPRLQREMGYSDLTPPSASAVRTCARAIGGERRFYSTDDVVADLDQLRAALGAPEVTFEATSYGTFVAEQYAIRHPTRTRALVLDSVVPHAGVDALDVAAIRAVPRVLRDACDAAGCPGDPAADLAAVVRRDHDGPQLLDLVTAMSIVDPTFEPLLSALHEAARGDGNRLATLQQGYGRGLQASAAQLSQGLHASALCSDSRFPWGTSAAPSRGRAAAVRRAVRGYPVASLWPFDRATAAGNGFVRQCQFWLPTPDAPLTRDGDLPDVPTLLLAGTHDLSTPLAWARAELRHAPGGRLVVVPGAGHGTVRQGGSGLDAMREFLLR
jgi:pimeloyl-ACP methyl ester carboxylesterase